MDRPRYPLCLPDFQLDRAEIHLEHHRDLSQEERTIKSRIRTLLPDITDEAMVAWIVYVDEVGRHGCFTKIPLALKAQFCYKYHLRDRYQRILMRMEELFCVYQEYYEA